MPRRYTVSMCASSRIFFVPLPSKRACTTLPIFAGVSSMRYAPSLGSTSSTLPPSAERRAAISLAARSRPSRSRLPVSIETSSFSVSRSGWRSFLASASTGSTGCAAARPGRAVARRAAVQRRRTSGLTVPPSGGGKTGFYPGRGGGVGGVPDIMRQVHRRGSRDFSAPLKPGPDDPVHGLGVRRGRNDPLPDADARGLRRRVRRRSGGGGMGRHPFLRRLSVRHDLLRSARGPLRQAAPDPRGALGADRGAPRHGRRAFARAARRRGVRGGRLRVLSAAHDTSRGGARAARVARPRARDDTRVPVSGHPVRAARGRVRSFVHRLALGLRDRRRDARRARARAPFAAAAQPAAHEPVLRLAHRLYGGAPAHQRDAAPRVCDPVPPGYFLRRLLGNRRADARPAPRVRAGAAGHDGDSRRGGPAPRAARLVLAHCGWMFACFAIFRKTIICSRTNLPNSSGFIGTDVIPILPNCSRTSFPCRIAFTWAFSFWTVAGGVPARPHNPNHSDRL